MNKKGQSLVLFVCLLPLVIFAFAYLFDTAYIMINDNKLDDIAYDAVSSIVVEQKDKEKVKSVILLNFEDIEIVEITDNNVYLKNELEPIFGKFIGYDKYELKVNLYGYIEDGKLVTKEKG